MIQALCFFLVLCSQIFGDDIAGFWKNIDEKTGKANCLIGIYKYQDQYFGRIIGLYDEKGNLADSIYHPIEKAPGVEGNPFYSGLDIILNLTPASFSYKGKVMDPRSGKIYAAEVWRDNENLILRGKLLMFGKNKTWYPTSKKDFPSKFKMPNLSEFIPVVY